MRYRLPSSAANVSAGPLSSMIDIIFLLIIFFVVTASFDREQIDSQVALPEADSAAIKSLPPRRVMVNVLADGSVRLGFRHIPAAETPFKLEDAMRSMRGDGRDTVLIVNGDRDTPHRYISEVMNAAARTGYSQVRVNAEVKKAGN